VIRVVSPPAWFSHGRTFKDVRAKMFYSIDFLQTSTTDR